MGKVLGVRRIFCLPEPLDSDAMHGKAQLFCAVSMRRGVAKAPSLGANGDSLELPLRSGASDSHDNAIFARKRGTLATIALDVRLFYVNCF